MIEQGPRFLGILRPGSPSMVDGDGSGLLTDGPLWLDEQSVALDECHLTPEAALRRCGQLLVASGKVEHAYTDALLVAFERYGAYMVIAPGVAVAHAAPGLGVHDLAWSVLTCDPPVAFGHPTNDPVWLVIGLATPDTEAHHTALRFLMSALGTSYERRYPEWE